MTPDFRSAREVREDFHNRFPLLKHTVWSIKSPSDNTYQCFAWAACRTGILWWPKGFYWPPNSPPINSVDFFVIEFGKVGYKPCKNSNYEFGYQKVAIYTTIDGSVTHMARQHFFGRGWLSKIGDFEDILHANLESIEGNPSPYSGTYGQVALILKRNWWETIFHLCLFRSIFCSFKFLIYRIKHPSLILDNVKNSILAK